jgi:type II secretory pathway pseudopilin PulG
MIRRKRRQPEADPRSRNGLTILEVLLALGIFLASATIITDLLGTGTRASVEGRLRSQMALLAESQMAEAGAGVLDLNSVSSQSFETDIEVEESLTWSMEVEEGEGDLLTVTVTVEHTNDQDEVDQSFSLTRLMRDPQIWIDAAEDQEE